MKNRARSTVLKEDTKPRVDRDERVIYGLSLTTEGEALGHGLWLDSQFVDSVVMAECPERGLRARFTHPGLCADALGKSLGRIRNRRRDGDRVRGDLFFAKYASTSPDGDLAAYAMDLAEEDPEACGMSIVFDRDFEKEDEHFEANSEEMETDFGKRKIFKSPDKKNIKNLRHARLDLLIAADLVDTPAANPAGLFSSVGLSGSEAAERAEALLGYALGLTDHEPDAALLGFHPERARVFLGEFMERHQLSLARKQSQQDHPEQKSAEAEEDAMQEKKAATLAQLKASFSDSDFIIAQLEAQVSMEEANRAWDRRRADLAEKELKEFKEKQAERDKEHSQELARVQGQLELGGQPTRYLGEPVQGAVEQAEEFDHKELGFADHEDLMAFAKADEAGLIRGSHL